jgi:hypothetical protein
VAVPLRGVLLATQVAISVVLLVSAGLLVRTINTRQRRSIPVSQSPM